MDDLKSKTKKLYELGIEQIKCIDDFFNKMIDLERILAECRINVSTAKAQNGFALSSVGFIDKRDIEPSVFINISKDGGIFEIVHPAEEEESKEKAKEDSKNEIRKRGGGGGKKGKAEKKKEKAADEDNGDGHEEKKKETKPSKQQHPQFRPFGLLEPRSAKQARAKADEAIQRVCELSTIQSKIFLIEKSIAQLNSEVMELLGDEYKDIVKISEKSKPSDSVKKMLKDVKWLEMPIVRLFVIILANFF